MMFRKPKAASTGDIAKMRNLAKSMTEKLRNVAENLGGIGKALEIVAASISDDPIDLESVRIQLLDTAATLKAQGTNMAESAEVIARAEAGMNAHV